MEDVIKLIYARYVGHLGDKGGVWDVRDIEVGIGTCLSVFLTKVTDLLTRCPKKRWDLLLVIVAVNPTFFGTPCSYLLSDRTDYRDAIASNKMR